MTVAPRLGACAVLLALVISPFIPLIAFADISIPVVSGNLIQNADLQDAAVATTPDHWTVAGYSDVATASYPIVGPANAEDKAVSISITTHNGGDAKWTFDAVPVTAGALYTFSDYYKSDIASSLVAAFTINGAPSFMPLNTLLPSTEWASTTTQFTAPVGATDVTIYHLISAVGTLSTDHYALVQSATVDQNIFSQGIVSLTFDDGWSSQYDNAYPAMKAANIKGSFYFIGTPTVLASHDLLTEAGQSVASSTTPNSATWSNIYPDPTNTKYRFIDTYTSTADSSLNVTFTLPDNSTSTISSSVLPAGTSQKGAFIFTLPTLKDASPITIKHESTGALTISNPSLLEYGGGYMSSDQMIDLQNNGQEIGSHTQSHCNLVRIYTDPASASSPDSCSFQSASRTVAQEVNDSKVTLNSFGANPLDTFAYPNGAYNDSIKTTVAQGGFTAARTVDDGYNTKNSDKYALKVKIVDAPVTFEQAKAWIDTAAANKYWLVLVFHQVDDPLVLTANGEDGGTTPAVFSQIVSYISTKSDISAKTVHDALALMGTVVTPPPVTTDTQAPTINLTGSNPIELTVGDVFTDPGATAVDNVDSSVTVTASGSVDTATAGTYTLTYTATDASHNTATVTRIVNVVAASSTPTTPTTPVTVSSGGGGGGYVGLNQTSGGYGILDFNILLINWGKKGSGVSGDFNADGVVDILDFNTLLINWKQ